MFIAQCSCNQRKSRSVRNGAENSRLFPSIVFFDFDERRNYWNACAQGWEINNKIDDSKFYLIFMRFLCSLYPIVYRESAEKKSKEDAKKRMNDEQCESTWAPAAPIHFLWLITWISKPRNEWNAFFSPPILRWESVTQTRLANLRKVCNAHWRLTSSSSLTTAVQVLIKKFVFYSKNLFFAEMFRSAFLQQLPIASQSTCIAYTWAIRWNTNHFCTWAKVNEWRRRKTTMKIAPRTEI